MDFLKEKIHTYFPDMMIIGGSIYLINLLVDYPITIGGTDNMFDSAKLVGKHEILIAVLLLLIGVDIAVRRAFAKVKK